MLPPEQINSPIQLESDDEEASYLSLQVPPGRAINDLIQFETLDMYIWTGPGFRSPALLFYAGPTYFEGEDDISSAKTGTEVSIVPLVKSNTLLWGLEYNTNVVNCSREVNVYFRMRQVPLYMYMYVREPRICRRYTSCEGGLSNNVGT